MGLFDRVKQLGPGLVTGAADDDPSGIATYSQAGAQFGTSLMWTMTLAYPLMVAVQLASARVGRVTGYGLGRNLKEIMPRWLVVSIVLLLFVANTINVGADLAAVGEAAALVTGGGKHALTIALAVFSLILQLYIPYHRYSSVLKWLTLVLFAYVALIFMIDVDWKGGVAWSYPRYPAPPLSLRSSRSLERPSAPIYSSGRPRRSSRNSSRSRSANH